MPAIGVHHTATADEAWDASANLKRLGDEPAKASLRAMHAWVDPSGDPETKAAYKLPHHEVSDSGEVGAANMKGVAAAMGRLNGGGLDIPEADRKAVYAHLAAHYKDADMEAPDLKAACGQFEKKELRFELKQVGEDGTFEGLLAAYGNVDLGNDLIEPGAFAKTILENKGQVPLLWQHKPDEPIGMLFLSDAPEGLRVKGVLDLNVQRAREAYSLMKKGIVKGLSIGFDAVKDAIENSVRRLKELRLWEGSVVTFPMNLLAVINSVKSGRLASERKDDFLAELQEIQVYAARWQMMQALCDALDEALYGDGTPEEKLAAAQTSLDQFQAAYLDMLPALLALMATDSDMGSMSFMSRMQAFEKKAGRVLSGANRDVITRVMEDMRACMEVLQALLDAADGPAEAGSKSTSRIPFEPGAAVSRSEPVNGHSAIVTKLEELKGVLMWTR